MLIYTQIIFGNKSNLSIYLIVYTNLVGGLTIMKTAKIFKNGQSQAVRLPKEFRLSGTEVLIKKQGNSIILTPIDDKPWQELIESLGQFTEDFMSTRNQPKNQSREDLF